MYNQRRYSQPNRQSGNRQHFARKQSKLQHVDPSVFIKKALEQMPQDVYVPQNTFADLAIAPALKQNILSAGYTTPTPIQDQAIPAVLEGKDVVGIANTGTGKTAAFLIPLLNKIALDRSQKILIVAPTRELAVQIEESCRMLARNMSIFSVLCIGGMSMYHQINALRRNPQVVIGTPGRLKDLERQGRLVLTTYNNIVLDEVDRMLDMGFITDITYLIGKLSQNRHSLFFSATLPDTVKKVMHSFLRNPVTISVKTQETAGNVEQNIVKTYGKDKVAVLEDLLSQKGFDKVLVFGRTKYGMEKLARLLDQRGFKVAAIHGNKNQNQRQRALIDFKTSRVQVLLATDIASRGLDIADVTHVINYDLPESYEDYIHRIGRTGRANNKGTALTLID